MPTINFTDNTDVVLTASSADNNATLNQYLKSLLTFKTPPSFAPIVNLPVKQQRELDFPITLSAAGEGNFAVGQTTLGVQLGASAAVGLLQGGDEAGFLGGLSLDTDSSGAGLVSFGVQGTLTASETAPLGDFTFGISKGAAFTLTSYYQADPNDTLGDSVRAAASALTIPHSIADLKSLLKGTICQLDATGSLSFSASFSYGFLNNPLATASLTSLPPFAINASSAATLEGSVTHSSDHTLTIAKLPNGLIHLSVSLTKTDDLETSLTVSAGATAKIGNQDALAFLLNRINPNSAAEAEAIASQMPDAAGFKADFKSAIDTALSTSFAASLRVALNKTKSNNRVFLYEIDLNKLDGVGAAALGAALTGNFTALTADSAALTGIKLLDSALTVTKAQTHTFALHLLGIFNASSISRFVETSSIDFTSDTHEIVLSDKTESVSINNLNGEKLRKLVLKDITLTLPASANTKDATTPITLAYFDRESSTSRSKLRQFSNVLNHVRAPQAASARGLLDERLDHYGVCSFLLGLSLEPTQCKKLFTGQNGPYDWTTYVSEFCKAQKFIITGDPDLAYRLLLFNVDSKARTWSDLNEAGTASNMTPILRGLGMSETQAQLAVTDVMTAVWWADAMAAYSTALARGQSLEAVGKRVVRNANNGYNEPWMVLTAWSLAGEPSIRAEFVTSSPQRAAAATAITGLG